MSWGSYSRTAATVVDRPRSCTPVFIVRLQGRAIVEALNALTAHVTLRTLQLLMKGHLHQGVKKQCADTYGIQYFFR